MEQTKRTQLETLISRMDSDYGDAYNLAHAELKALIRDILKPSGLKVKLGKTYSTLVPHAYKSRDRRYHQRVEFYRDGGLVRTVSVCHGVSIGPSAYSKAKAILEVTPDTERDRPRRRGQ